MKKLLLVVLLIALPVSGAQVALRNPRADVVSAYHTIASLSANQARATYRALPADMQEDVWLVHLEEFLVAHPELNDDQRAVVLEGIGFLATGMAELRGDGGEMPAGARIALAAMTERAKASLGATLAAQAFNELGGPKADHLPLRAGATFYAAPHSPYGTPECDCAGDSDWCYSESYCKASNCTPMWGCGTFWWYTCNGVCNSTL